MRGAAALSLLLLFAVVALPALAQPVGEEVVLDPAAGPTGTNVTLETAGLPAGADVGVFFDVEEPPQTEAVASEAEVATGTVGADGALEVSFVVPAGSPLPTTVLVCTVDDDGLCDGAVSRTATFEHAGTPVVTVDPNSASVGETVRIAASSLASPDACGPAEARLGDLVLASAPPTESSGLFVAVFDVTLPSEAPNGSNPVRVTQTANGCEVGTGDAQATLTVSGGSDSTAPPPGGAIAPEPVGPVETTGTSLFARPSSGFAGITVVLLAGSGFEPSGCEPLRFSLGGLLLTVRPEGDIEPFRDGSLPAIDFVTPDVRAGTYSLNADQVCPDETVRASTLFTVKAPPFAAGPQRVVPPIVSVAPQQAAAGHPAVVRGAGFFDDQPLEVQVNNAAVAVVSPGQPGFTSFQGFTVVITVPEELQPGSTAPVQACQPSCAAPTTTAQGTLQIVEGGPPVTVSPTEGPPTSVLVVSGFGPAPEEPAEEEAEEEEDDEEPEEEEAAPAEPGDAEIRFGDRVLATVPASELADGTFEAQVTWPVDGVGGPQPLVVCGRCGEEGETRSTVMFRVTPLAAVTPGAAKEGTVVTVEGLAFDAYAHLDWRFDVGIGDGTEYADDSGRFRFRVLLFTNDQSGARRVQFISPYLLPLLAAAEAGPSPAGVPGAPVGAPAGRPLDRSRIETLVGSARLVVVPGSLQPVGGFSQRG